MKGNAKKCYKKGKNENDYCKSRNEHDKGDLKQRKTGLSTY